MNLFIVDNPYTIGQNPSIFFYSTVAFTARYVHMHEVKHLEQAEDWQVSLLWQPCDSDNEHSQACSEKLERSTNSSLLTTLPTMILGHCLSCMVTRSASGWWEGPRLHYHLLLVLSTFYQLLGHGTSNLPNLSLLERKVGVQQWYMRMVIWCVNCVILKVG